ncbi:hypothetical protein HYH03_000018 [Edaphochlamys debaryana]|uniref:tRNA 4-demethylwyosine synthase (AdoMet-dependent) n=1 Tax=Edaphochlamys debaryana TaxID=47281 RepID=A0A835YFC3_9CHLO|nr:hypothetical protein HYH03_000018 [Edaphochlamys debaryana]|eukprot:KAG2501511.1 hypothetical protein HYH03_000018 [Edaphochlamys debaryana]
MSWLGRLLTGRAPWGGGQAPAASGAGAETAPAAAPAEGGPSNAAGPDSAAAEAPSKQCCKAKMEASGDVAAEGCACQTATAPAGAAPVIKVLYGSTGGTCRRLAAIVAEQLTAALPAAATSSVTAATPAGACGNGGCPTCTPPALDAVPAAAPAAAAATAVEAIGAPTVSVVDLASYEPEALLGEARDTLVVVVISTHEGGTPPQSAKFFCSWLEDASSDFRLGAAALNHVRFAVYGAGNSLYGAQYNAVARRLEVQLLDMGARRAQSLGLGDEDTGDMAAHCAAWARQLAARLAGPRGAQAQAQQGPGGEAAAEGEGQEEEEEEEEDDAFEEEDDDEEGGGSEVDIEDLGGAGPRRGKKGAAAAGGAEGAAKAPGPGGKPEMLTPLVRGSLTKQGYKLIGSHSGVKMCRWTKSMLRGRGGCYKHAFYGIESHRCMEATPSLACANKCVFCWRHHSNPVGKTWKWAMDPPELIVENALEAHRRMVREYSGVPGVKPEAVAEGLAVRHCALSLVGEPIMYPEINALVAGLHGRGISTFLVTNAQFPDRMAQLSPVTQLYVSVDAATPESLKAVDRPLFADYWERFTACLSSLRERRQRTVYRLTLVKGWNMKEVAAYAALLDLGRPDFVEIKGVTYCGSGGASSLTMANVPYHADVVAFGQAICEARGGEYGLACEHAHSCCLLLARTERFLVGGRWHTWIDYERFQQLVAEGRDFGSEDYMLPTPPWAAFGSSEAGFDPGQQRVRKERRHPGRSGAASVARGDDEEQEGV